MVDQSARATGIHVLGASVVIAALDAEETIGVQLAALAAQEPPFEFEVVIADNGSIDNTNEVVRKWLRRVPGLRIVDASAQRGAGFARNIGAGAALGEVLVFCDADDEVQPGWLESIAAAALVHGMATGPVRIAGRGSAPGYGGNGLDVPFGFLPTAPTANLAVCRDLFDRLGGFTTQFAGAGGEDADLCWRAQLDEGAELVFVPEASITYHSRPTLRGRIRRVWHYEQCNAQLYKMYRQRGMIRDSPRLAMRRLSWITRHPVTVVRDPIVRDRSIRWLTIHTSRLVASIRFRLFFP